jgi:hypothetical protein
MSKRRNFIEGRMRDGVQQGHALVMTTPLDEVQVDWPPVNSVPAARSKWKTKRPGIPDLPVYCAQGHSYVIGAHFKK